jgi:preprotein translocase subunit SecG
MSVLLIILHVVVCIALILIVLLQTGKGADIGAAFGGGGSQTLFGSTGASTFLSKATTVAAIVFMLTSLSLAYIYSSGPGSGSSIMTESAAPPESPPAAAAPAGQAPATSETTPATPAPPAAPAAAEPAATQQPAPPAKP